MKNGRSPVEAVAAALPRLRGAFALAFLFDGEDDLLIGARKGSPLAIGYGDGEMYLGSDAIALAPFTDTISYLEDGDSVVLTRKGAEIHDAEGRRRRRATCQSRRPAFLVDKGNHRHFMAKEIHEQPEVVGHTLGALPRHGRAARVRCRWRCRSISARSSAFRSPPAAPPIMPAWSPNTGSSASRGCRSRSTSPRSSATARRRSSRAGWRSSSRNRARPPTRWRRCATPRSTKQHVLSVVNVPTSTIARESDVVMPTLAGPEIGVASTKAFTCQLAVLACLAIAAGRARGVLSEDDERKLVRALIEVPRLMAEALALEPQIEQLARDLAKSRDVLYLGRGTSYPIALEGALKLKEISYIHAEGYAAGELKHGPIALIDENMPVIVIAPHDRVFEKTVSNMQEVAARGGRIILLTDPPAPTRRKVKSLAKLTLPGHAGDGDAAGLCDPGAAHRLSHRGGDGHRRRPAAQPRQIGHGGIFRRPATPAAAPWRRGPLVYPLAYMRLMVSERMSDSDRNPGSPMVAANAGGRAPRRRRQAGAVRITGSSGACAIIF